MLNLAHDHPPIVTLEGTNSQPTSIRAKAQVFFDPASRALLKQIQQLGPSDAPVLIIGETGTGKELVARQLHQLSGRAGPFIAVNCGAISEQLAESELFGHEAGAFTGATQRRIGWFEAADGGTLFLDEIGDLPPNLQVKLLRVLQEREVVRVGARKPTPVDIRLVAATNVDLADAVTAGHFRLDLLYRLNIAQIDLPPLRNRIGDILPLAEYFLGLYCKRLGTKIPDIHPDTIRQLEAYAWPGNIRELENVVHYAVLISSGQQILPKHLKLSGAIRPAGREPVSPEEHITDALKQLLASGAPDLFNRLEWQIITTAFNLTGENQVRTASLLGISRNVLRTLLKKHGLLGKVEDDTELAEAG
ncbi:sigma-54 dependent transcriptional regulator [Burkholderiaceae bacterium DAT-1]|nr:sigma-54 dependent transcriptional regulator [Burkholderiaceae bacterium DAT-1]